MGKPGCWAAFGGSEVMIVGRGAGKVWARML